MLTRLIVDLYAWIIEIFLWFLILISGVAGYLFTVPLLDAAGLILEVEITGKILGALVFASAAFLMAAVFAGPFLVLVDIRKSVKALEIKRSNARTETLQTKPKEPFLRDPG